jgi:excisionase family DNA binding protein
VTDVRLFLLEATMMIPDLFEKPTLTVEETAELLGVGRNTAYEAVRTGDLPAIRVGRRILVPTQPLLTLIGVTATVALPTTTKQGPSRP